MKNRLNTPFEVITQERRESFSLFEIEFSIEKILLLLFFRSTKQHLILSLPVKL